MLCVFLMLIMGLFALSQLGTLSSSVFRMLIIAFGSLWEMKHWYRLQISLNALGKSLTYNLTIYIFIFRSARK